MSFPVFRYYRKTRFPIAATVRPVGQWIRDEWILKTHRSFWSFRFPKREVYPVLKGPFRYLVPIRERCKLLGGYPKTSSGPSVGKHSREFTYLSFCAVRVNPARVRSVFPFCCRDDFSIKFCWINLINDFCRNFHVVEVINVIFCHP